MTGQLGAQAMSVEMLLYIPWLLYCGTYDCVFVQVIQHVMLTCTTGIILQFWLLKFPTIIGGTLSYVVTWFIAWCCSDF